MAERTRQEVGANRAEVTSALQAVAANNAQLVAWGNVAFEQRDRALRQTVREEFDGYSAHIAVEMQEDIPAHVEARSGDNMAASTVKLFAAALIEEAHHELISVEGSSATRQARVQEELVRARHGEEPVRRAVEYRNGECSVVGSWRQRHLTTPVFMLKIVANDFRKASSVNAIALQSLSLFLRMREPSCGKSRPWSLNFKTRRLACRPRLMSFVEQYAESTKCVIDRECSDVKKHERDLVENAEALAMSSGPHGQTSAPANEYNSANMSNEVCYKSCSLHKSIYSDLQRDHRVCFDSHSGSPADPALSNVNCPGIFLSSVVATVGTCSI